jgi:hypothetical protein
MSWQITYYPRCLHHVFLSHCAIDRTSLVHPVHEELKRRTIVPWLDRDDYYHGRDSRSALRDGLLDSRHVVYFVTLGLMDYKRGWCAMEAAYSDLVQANLVYPGGNLLNFELALFFLDRAYTGLPGTVWDRFRDSGKFHHPSDGDAVAWAVNEIVEFLHREQKLALDRTKELLPGRPVYDDLSNVTGLIDRVTQFDPTPIP